MPRDYFSRSGGKVSITVKILNFMSSPPCRDVLVICRGVAIYPDQNPETVGTLSRSGPGFLHHTQCKLQIPILSGLNEFVTTGFRRAGHRARRKALSVGTVTDPQTNEASQVFVLRFSARPGAIRLNGLPGLALHILS
jgi:hypothetical protein